MEVNDSMDCCGIREINNLKDHRDPESAMKAFMGEIAPIEYAYGGGEQRRDKFRYAIFSGAGRRSLYAPRFAAYITMHNLGEIVHTGYHLNPNSMNQLKVWVWTVDHEAL